MINREEPDAEFKRLVGQQLRAARRAADLTQERAAEIIGVSKQAVSAWERGKDLPEYPHLIKAADAYRVSIDWLLGRPGSTEVTDPTLHALASGEWPTFAEDEQDIVREAINMARKAKALRERRTKYDDDGSSAA